MIWRKISFNLAKIIVALLCLIAILLTTPWGTWLTVSLLNNIDGIEIDYKAGALVRDIELNALHINTESINIDITGLVADIDFSCSWKKAICFESLKVTNFSVNLISTTESNTATEDKSMAANDNSLLIMPFSINAKKINLLEGQVVIDQTTVEIKQLSAAIEIHHSQFAIVAPQISSLTISQKKNSHSQTSQPDSATKINELASIISELPVVSLPIALTIQRLSINELLVKNPNTLRFEDSQLSANWEKSDVKIDHFQTSTNEYYVGLSKADIQLIPPYKIDAQLTTRIDNLSAWPELSNSSQNIQLNGALNALTLNAKGQGSLTFSSQSHVDLTDNELPFNLQLSADKLPLPLSVTQYAKPSSLDLSITGNLSQQNFTLLSSLNSYGYQNAQLQLTAHHQQGVLNIAKLTLNDKITNSHLHLNGKIDIQPSNMQWELFANSTGVTLPKINLAAIIPTDLPPALLLPQSLNGRFQGKIASTGKVSDSQWAFALHKTDLTGTINNMPLNIKGDIALNQSGYVSSGNTKQGKLFASLADNQLTINTVNDKNWHLDGKLVIANIRSWYRDASGAINAEFTIKESKDNPVISLKSEIKHFAFQKITTPSVKITANYQPFIAHKSQLTIESENLALTNNDNNYSFDNIAINLTGDINNQQLNAQWQGDIAGKLAITGQSDHKFEHWLGKVEQGSLSYKDAQWHADKVFSLNLDINKQQLLIAKHCWLGKGLDVCLPVDANVGKTGDINLALDIDLSLIDELFLPKEIEINSKINGELTAQWSPLQPALAKGKLTLLPGNVKVSDDYSEQQMTQWRNGELSFSLNEQLLRTKLFLQDSIDHTLININSTVEFKNEFPIDSTIVLNQFNLQPFQSVIAKVVDLKGDLSADLHIKGTISSPLINGKLALDKGELLLSQNPNKFEKIKTNINVINNQATIDSEFFIEQSKGSLNGNLQWQDTLQMNVDLHAEKLPIIFPPQLAMHITPVLNFSLQDKILSISGNIDVLDGSYDIEKLPEGSITLSDDVVIIDAQGKEVFKQTSGFDIQTDVRVNIANDFQVSGQGLQSHLEGQLHIQQQKKHPLQLFGTIQSTSGTYQAYGQKLQIDRGKLTFNGPMNNPYFDLRASRQVKAEDVEVGLQITGLVDSLALKLFSTPTMESPEILSYLVRGRGLDAGGGNGNAATSMLLGYGVTSSAGLFEQIEKIPLINNIAVDTEGDGDETQATISGYIGNRVYLKYGIGVYEPINELTVRLYFLNRLWLEVVSGIEQSSDLYYSFDVD